MFGAGVIAIAVTSWIVRGYISTKGGHRTYYSTEPVAFCLWVSVFLAVELLFVYAFWREVVGRPIGKSRTDQPNTGDASADSDESSK